MSTKSDQHAAKQEVMTMRYNYGLATRRNHPVAQRKMGTAINAISLVTVTYRSVVRQDMIPMMIAFGLATVSNQPVVKLEHRCSCFIDRLATVSNQPVVKPLRMNPHRQAALGNHRGYLQGLPHKVLGRDVLAAHGQRQVGGENRFLGRFFPSFFGGHNANLSPGSAFPSILDC